MNSGNSSKINQIDDNHVVGGDNKNVDIRIESNDKNIIRENSWIGGNSILGDNRGNSSSTVNDPVVKRNPYRSGCHNKKLNVRFQSDDKNMIRPNSHIGGNSILGDKSGNSGKINDNPVLGNSNNTQSNNNESNPVLGVDNILNNLLKAGLNFDYNEVNWRFKSSDKNIIGADCEIQGDAIVGDGSGNNEQQTTP